MQRKFKIAVNGVDYQVSVEELGAEPLAAVPAPAAAAPSVAAPTVAAPIAPAALAPVASQAVGSDEAAQMGGIIAHIYVKVGQMVGEGERLLDIEAMKMKIPLISSKSGTVTRLLVSEGDPVENGQALLSIA